MEKEKNVIFEAFARKAAERIEERKKLRTMRLMVKSVGMEVENGRVTGVRLTRMELTEKDARGRRGVRAIEGSKIYMASPTLQNAAKILVEEGTLKQHYKITEMFTGSERTFIVNKVLELSGMTGDAKIEVIREDEEIKNS